MRPRLYPYLRRNPLVLVFLLILSCDTFREDSIDPEKNVTFSHTEFYIVPQLSTVIDIRSVISQSFVSASLEISKQPQYGSLTQIDPFLLKYTPDEGFLDGKDQFVFSVLLDNGATIQEETMTIFVEEAADEFPCGLYAVEDVVRLTRPALSKISLLKNDRICGISGSLELTIFVAPKFGQAEAVGDSILIYTPASSFTGKDELVYRLSSPGSHPTYGLVSITETRTESSQIPNGMVDIFFVNDTTGFMAGGSDIYKTINGGKSWNLLAYPRSQIDDIDFQEIFFLDADAGFAVYTECFGGMDECIGGWIKTTDGGTSWVRQNLDLAPYSIFFTSPLTGFIATLKDVTDISGGRGVLHNVLKTIDGGVTWSPVLTTETEWGELKVRFVNDKLGYAYRPEDIFVTNDAGETWEVLTSHDYIISLALAPENILSASFTTNNLQVTTPSTIVRSEGGAAFVPTVSFSYMIMAHGFSPNGNLGVAIGISDPNATLEPETQVLTISKSTDKGITWVNLQEHLVGFPWVMSVPSENVAYILCSDKIIKYSP